MNRFNVGDRVEIADMTESNIKEYADNKWKWQNLEVIEIFCDGNMWHKVQVGPEIGDYDYYLDNELNFSTIHYGEFNDKA